MEKYLVYQDEESQKFWWIKTDGLKMTLTYGQVGSKRQRKTQSFDFDSVQECNKEVDKMMKSKLKCGYVVSVNPETQALLESTKRYTLSADEVWEQGRTINTLIAIMDKDAQIEKLKHITIGCWGESYDNGVQPILDFFVDNQDRLRQLESLFVGDMDYEECEISWIEQGDYTEVIKAFPRLKKLQIKGSEGLILSPLKHEKLEHLEIICGGLPSTVLDDIANAALPQLKTLVLYLGDGGYGFDGDIEDVKKILYKNKFPNLTYLGIVNSEIENEVVAAVLASDILPQLETLSFGYGCLTDEGGNLLLAEKDKLAHLKTLDLTYHYLTDEMMAKMTALPMQVIVAEQQDLDYDDDGKAYLYPMFGE